MALASIENAKLKRTLLWFALAGVAIAILLFFGGSLIGTLVGRKPVVAETVGTLALIASNDADADGVIDPLSADEHPVAAAEITLAGANLTQELETDEAGFAEAIQLPIGTYAVSAFVGGEQVSVEPTSISVAPDERDVQLALNTAGKQLGGVYGFAYEDSDGNGSIDATDVPVAGATASLSGGAEERTTTTDDKGRYEFGGLEPGQYAVRIGVPTDELERFSEPAALTTVLEVRSNIDRRRADVLLALVQPTAAGEPELRLAQAPLLPGIEILKLATDADEAGKEFVRATPGSEVSYEITLQARGTSGETYTSVVVVDDYPVGIEPVSIGNGGVDNGSTITWSVGTMMAGDVVVLGYDSRIDSGAADGNYENVASVTANGVLPTEDDSTVIVDSRATSGAGQDSDELPGSTGGAGSTTAGSGGSTSASGTDVVVGIQGWQLAAAVAVPAAVVVLVIALGLRRVRA